MGEVLEVNVEQISNKLLSWYSSHFRPLPWRSDPTPYHIWISEIMLQQTRIEAVLPYYDRFITALPTIKALAEVPQEQLLKLWEGLGYYSRARNLQKTAQILMQEYDGKIPADYERILALPGIGPYTAGAIASIAFSIPVPAVDGNVMRVLSRLTGDATDVLSTAGKKTFTDLAWQLVPEQNPGRFNQALMELGERVCLPNTTPKCEICPLRDECVAFREGTTTALPVRIKKTKRRLEKRQVVVAITGENPPRLLIHQRENSGLLASLWELPNALSDNPLDALPTELQEGCIPISELPSGKHLFSHIEWQMSGWLYHIPLLATLPNGYALADYTALQKGFPLPGAFRHFAKLFPKLLNKEQT